MPDANGRSGFGDVRVPVNRSMNTHKSQVMLPDVGVRLKVADNTQTRLQLFRDNALHASPRISRVFVGKD